MLVFAAVVLGIWCIAGVALTAAGLPGTWLMVLGALGVEAWTPEMLSWNVIIAAAVLSVIGEVAEFVAGAIGAKKAGGSKRAALGAIAGGVVGAIVGTVTIPIPIVGTIIGSALGSGLAAAGFELTIEGRRGVDARRVGTGAFIGRLVATVLKSMCAVMIAGILVASSIAPGW